MSLRCPTSASSFIACCYVLWLAERAVDVVVILLRSGCYSLLVSVILRNQLVYHLAYHLI